MPYLRTLSASLLLAIVAVSLPAQTPPAAADDAEKAKKKQALIEARRLMIEEMIEAAQAFRLPENKIYVLSNAAGLLWKTDEKRAQELYREAIAVFLEFRQAPEEGLDAIPERPRWQAAGARQQLLHSLGQHHPQLALEFLESTRVPADQQNPNAVRQEAHLEASLLQQIAAKDPKRAYERAQKLIAEGAPLNSLWPLISSLTQQDYEAAKNLCATLLAKLQSRSSMDPESMTFLIQLLSGGSRGIVAEPDASPTRKSLFSAAETQQLIDKILLNIQKELTAAKQQNDQGRIERALNQLSLLNRRAGLLEKSAPASAAAIQKNWSQAEPMMNPQQRGWDTLNGLAAKGSVEAIVEAAAKVPTEMRQSYYQRASQLAMEKGDLEGAKNILKEHIEDKDRLRYMLDDLDRQFLWKKVNESKLEEARKLTPKFRDVFERVNYLVSLAQNAQNQGKKELAVELLEEAWALVAGPTESSQQLSSQLQLAGVYASINPTRGFEILESSIEQINELSAAAAVVESFQGQSSYRKKEMLLNSGGGTSGQYIHSYSQALVNLLSEDPEHVHTILGRFSRLEIRVLLQSQVLQQSDGAGRMGDNNRTQINYGPYGPIRRGIR